MEHIIGGWTENPNQMIKEALDFFERRFSRSFEFEGISEHNYLMGIIKEKHLSQEKKGIIFLDNNIIKSSYYNKIPDFLKVKKNE